ncbi:20647_t:CDS:2 [Gigaspora rosea]|nr:20647_t:CDS:2 [Gigaspora rosea]
MPKASNNNQRELDDNWHKKILAVLNKHKNDPNKGVKKLAKEEREKKGKGTTKRKKGTTKRSERKT